MLYFDRTFMAPLKAALILLYMIIMLYFVYVLACFFFVCTYLRIETDGWIYLSYTWDILMFCGLRDHDVWLCNIELCSLVLLENGADLCSEKKFWEEWLFAVVLTIHWPLFVYGILIKCGSFASGICIWWRAGTDIYIFFNCVR